MVEFRESDFHNVLNSFYEGVCYLNSRGEVQYYNSEALVQWESHRLQANKLISLAPVARALAGEHVYHDLVHLDKERDLLVSALPLYTGTNVMNGVMIISQDVSEHVVLEHEARTALNVLLEATLDTFQLDDLDEVLRRITKLISQLGMVDNSFAFRLDETTGSLTPVALFGISQQSFEEWQSELATIQLSTEQAMRQSSPAYVQAIKLGRTFMVDFKLDAQHSNPRNLLAAIYAPIFLRGHVAGLLGVERHRPLEKAVSYFPQWSVDLLTAMARLASMSLEKGALLTSMEHLQTESEALRSQLSQKEEYLLLTAHELKNPLTSILGQAQIMQRRLNRIMQGQTQDSQQRNDLLNGLKSIEHQARRIEHMTNTLVEVSRIELDRLELYLEEFDLLRLVRQTMKDHLPLTSQHDLRLFVHGEPESIQDDDSTRTILIQADEKRLEQVLSNLIGNAIKYSPEGGPITVSLRVIDDQVIISVEDQGIGVPLHEQTRLTERFYRAENASATNAKGLGLGLYLVHSLVKRHGGQISIKSEGVPRKGSVFSVSLPLRKPEAEEQRVM